MAHGFTSEWLAGLAAKRGADSVHGPRRDPVVEQDPRDGADGAAQAQKEDPCRYRVVVESRRHRLLDEDNLCAKYHVDVLRYLGLLPSDAPQRCQIRCFQTKIPKDQPEVAVITLYSPQVNKVTT